jgi:chaperonin GroEL
VPELEQLAMRLDGDEAFGVAILAKALAAPLRTIARNAGANPSIVVNDAAQRGLGYTFDATCHAWVDPWNAGIVDPLSVAIRALEAAVSAAAMTLTTEVLVRRKKPEYATKP